MIEYTSVKDLLAVPGRWCQNMAALNAAGERTSPLADSACQWCLIGAINKVYPDRGKRMEVKFAMAFYLRRKGLMIDPKDYPGALSSAIRIICQWQDHFSTTHTDILELLEDLDV